MLFDMSGLYRVATHTMQYTYSVHASLGWNMSSVGTFSFFNRGWLQWSWDTYRHSNQFCLFQGHEKISTITNTFVSKIMQHPEKNSLNSWQLLWQIRDRQPTNWPADATDIHRFPTVKMIKSYFLLEILDFISTIGYM